MKISVIGTGYLGATHAACMAELGLEVVGVDNDAAKIEALSRGELPFYEPELPELLSKHVKSGKLKALAITSLERSSLMPEIPTMAESGYPGYEDVTLNILMAPAGTPKEIIQKNI